MKEYISWMEKSESTMDEAKKISTGNRWFFISSESQTHGKGTNDRNWKSDIGNGFITIGINKKIISPDRSRLLPLEVSVTLYQTICRFIKKDFVKILRIKWPNDILFNHKKTAGILIEKSEDYFLIGIGINIGTAPVLTDGGRKSCCLTQFGMKPENRKKLLISVYNDLKTRLSNPASLEKITEEWKRYVNWNYEESLRLKPWIKVKPLDINYHGHLLVRFDNGVKTWLIAEYLV